MQGVQVQSLVGELRAHKPCGTTKKKTIIINKVYTTNRENSEKENKGALVKKERKNKCWSECGENDAATVESN